MSRRIVIVRTLGLLGALGLLVALAGADLPSALGALRDPQHIVDTLGADVLVLYLLQLVLVALSAWCAMCVVLLAATSLRPSVRLGRVTMRLTPRGGRRLLAAALGVGTFTLAACGTPSDSSAATMPSTAPAYAASSDAFDWALEQPAPAGSGAVAEAAGDDPAEATRPGVASPEGASPEVTGGAVPPAVTHVVASGDCLWEIANDHLGPGATTAEVAYLVDEIYQTNQESIGENPDILPIGATIAIPDS